MIIYQQALETTRDFWYGHAQDRYLYAKLSRVIAFGGASLAIGGAIASAEKPLQAAAAIASGLCVYAGYNNIAETQRIEAREAVFTAIERQVELDGLTISHSGDFY